MTKDTTDKDYQTSIEQTMEGLHYESFDEWVQNFALNLPSIWREPSARDLDPTSDPSYKKEEHSSIVIGRGPSLKKYRHLELLAKSDYRGTIVCTDGALKQVLKAGVTPDKFPKFYVVTIDPYRYAKKFYDDPIIDKKGNKINGIFSTIANPLVVKRARKAGIKIHWLHSLFDYNQGKKSFNQISSLMVRAKNHSEGLPAIQTGANAGTSAWFVSWQILNRAKVALIGINHAWEEDDPWEKIITHGRNSDSERKNEQVTVDRDSPSFEKLFKKIYNPEFDCYCIVDPLFQFYSEALKEFIFRSPSWVNTFNATEGGSIFGKRINCITFKKFLQQYKE